MIALGIVGALVVGYLIVYLTFQVPDRASYREHVKNFLEAKKEKEQKAKKPGEYFYENYPHPLSYYAEKVVDAKAEMRWNRLWLYHMIVEGYQNSVSGSRQRKEVFNEALGLHEKAKAETSVAGSKVVA